MNAGYFRLPGLQRPSPSWYPHLPRCDAHPCPPPTNTYPPQYGGYGAGQSVLPRLSPSLAGLR